ERLYFLAGFQIPQLEGAIIASGNRQFSICGQRHASDNSLMATESEQGLAGLEIPELERLVGAAAEEMVAFLGQGNTRDAVGVSGESPRLRTLGRPELECVIGARGNDVAFAIDREGLDRSFVSTPGPYYLAVIQVPEGEGIGPAADQGLLAARQKVDRRD